MKVIREILNRHDKNIVKPVIGAITVFVFFVLISFLVNLRSDSVIELLKVEGYQSHFIYILVTIIATVFAPVTTLPLVPIASAVFGWQIAGLLYVIGLMVGSYIAFLIARYIGLPFFTKFVSEDKIYSIEKLIPENNLFLVLIFLRMSIPVDILSYAIGFFSKIGHIKYLLATFIGILPFAFIFSYVGLLPIGLQSMIFFEIFLILFSAHFLYKGEYSLKNIRKVIILFLFLMATIALFSYGKELIDAAGQLKNLTLEHPLLSASILILLKTIATPLGFPGTPLTLLTGSLFGVIWGTIIALIGNTFGAILAFIFSRYILREYVQKKIVSKYEKLRSFEKRIDERATSTVLALRLIPLFPFNAVNFFLGVTNIPLRKFAIGSFAGMIPGTIAFVYLGGSLTILSPINIAIALAGIILLTVIGKFYEKRF